MKEQVFIGTAGWNIPKQVRRAFKRKGSHLERYSQKFKCVEINSSFYRHHKARVYKKWKHEVPENFKFAVKLSKTITHEKKLKVSAKEIKAAINPILELGEKLGILLIQLPPSLKFELNLAGPFMKNLRNQFSGKIVWEPRHKSWKKPSAQKLFREFEMCKVIADPEPCPIPKSAKKFLERIRYYRLHGAPVMYRSKYSKTYLNKLRKEILKGGNESWVIFDNTTFGHGMENALELSALSKMNRSK